MKKITFPYIAFGLGIFLTLVVWQGSAIGADGSTRIPLLTLLVVCEFAFFVTAAGTYIGIRHFKAVQIKPVYAIVTGVCCLMAVRFMILGVELWPL